MIYILIKSSLEWLEAHNLGFLRVFTYTTFRAVAATVLSFLICVVLAPRVIRWLRSQKIADLAGFDQAEIDKLMSSKKGTPTMGGILIISSIAVTTLLLCNIRDNFYVHMAIVCMFWLAVVGATDDWLKLTAGKHDDEVDTASLIGRAIDQAHPAIVRTQPDNKPRDRWSKALDKQEGGLNWKTI